MHPVPLHPRISIIVTRVAFTDAPDKIIRVDDSQTTEDVLERYYPGKTMDRRGGFDTPDGGSYLWDRGLTD